MGAKYRPHRQTVGLDPFVLSRTTTLGNMKLQICDTRYEHAREHTDLAIRGDLSRNVGVGIIRGLDDEELGSFAFCLHCGILKLSREQDWEEERSTNSVEPLCGSLVCTEPPAQGGRSAATLGCVVQPLRGTSDGAEP